MNKEQLMARALAMYNASTYFTPENTVSQEVVGMLRRGTTLESVKDYLHMRETFWIPSILKLNENRMHDIVANLLNEE